MKVVGGSFGVSGSVDFTEFNDETVLRVVAAGRHLYTEKQIKSVTASQTKERTFSIIIFLLWGAMLCLPLGFFFGPLGVLVGLGVAVAVAFTNETQNHVEIDFDDGKSVVVQCSARQAEDLAAFRAT